MTSSDIRVRHAIETDASAIATILNQAIEERIATFETEPRTAAWVLDQLSARGERFPTIVVERGGRVVAWSSASRYRDRACYAGIAEHSVYVERSARGGGLGLIALDALCAACADRGFWKLLSRIFPENTASLALHQRAGFRVVGVYQRHGKLDGEWRDCVIVEKLLDDALHDEPDAAM
jgi:L-amino acid N-acyltransferase YncA